MCLRMCVYVYVTAYAYVYYVYMYVYYVYVYVCVVVKWFCACIEMCKTRACVIITMPSIGLSGRTTKAYLRVLNIYAPI